MFYPYKCISFELFWHLQCINRVQTVPVKPVPHGVHILCINRVQLKHGAKEP
ncbi:hypothetical protein HUN01_28650 [Nostoc edaphicum CCNP1411]|uniref:Uncharacterized protein n=1 Tax=Nostoc edaphicum CCNP1411 TaxID=1472755 RepID=A0A7D7QB36_9NOSO|nr:hypothetical protein HUN01_28650 [Nostoc edaphicum CCNP1411]